MWLVGFYAESEHGVLISNEKSKRGESQNTHYSCYKSSSDAEQQKVEWTQNICSGGEGVYRRRLQYCSCAAGVGRKHHHRPGTGSFIRFLQYRNMFIYSVFSRWWELWVVCGYSRGRRLPSLPPTYILRILPVQAQPPPLTCNITLIKLISWKGTSSALQAFTIGEYFSISCLDRLWRLRLISIDKWGKLELPNLKIFYSKNQLWSI